MSANPWQNLERELNPRQREAVFTQAPHCLVLAGPGTGKTRTLVNRVVYLVMAQGIDPESILPLTFTRKAAKVMVDRLARYLGDRAAKTQPGTFHHFGLRLLREQAGNGEIPRDFSIADEPRQLRTLGRAWNRLGFSSREPEDKELRLLLGRFAAYRLDRDSDLLSKLQVELFEAYQELLRAEGALDFDDILDLTRGLLERDASFLAAMRERWTHILVDEFQDTDALQYRILQLLIGESATSFLVADDQQSIYAWRGADRLNIERYREDFAPSEVCLNENYRNAEAILGRARALMAGAASGESRELISRVDETGSMRVERFPSEREEAEFLAADIRSARSRDRTLGWREIAILYPKHAIGEYLETRLMAERVPVELVAGRALLGQDRIRRLIAFLRILRNGSDGEALETLLAGHLDEGAFALLRRVIRHNGDSPRAGLDAILRSADELRRAAQRWERFRESGRAQDDTAWVAAWRDAYSEGFGFERLLPPEPESPEQEAEVSDPATIKARGERDGERLRQLARLTWRLDGFVARISNLRVGHGGRTLSQLVREILLEVAEDEESAPPGDPMSIAGLEELLARLRALLRKGGRVLVRAGNDRAATVLAALLREGLEPWIAQNIDSEEGSRPPTATLIIGPGDLTLAHAEGAELRVDGAPGALLLMRLYQLWRAAEHRSLSDFVIFDLETTGVDIARDEVIEIGAIRFEGGKEQARFSSFVKPKGSIPPDATAVHGIDDEMVADAPTIDKVLPEFFAFIGDRDLVAHNGARFDFPFVRRLARECKLPAVRNALFDTLALARRLFPGDPVSLEKLIERFGINAEARHRALDDCRCLGEAFREMQILHLGELRRRAGAPALAPAALALFLSGESPPEAEADATNHALFRMGVRRLMTGGSQWLERFLDRDERPMAESRLLALAGLTGEAPELFTGLRSVEERFLGLVPRFDELFLGDSLASFLDFLALYQAPDLGQDLDAVQLMTIHSAKGLEFRRVYILGLEENVLPGYYALRGGDEAIGEERRLLYVAMTRAAESLTLSTAASRSGFSQEPSRFLADITPAEGQGA